MDVKRIICKNCGAPITTEICPYCKTFTQIPTDMANADYPVLKCKSAELNFFKGVFPLLFGGTFLIVCILCASIFMTIDDSANSIIADNPRIGLLFLIPFALVAVISLGIWLLFIIRYLKVKISGKETTATVYGYMQGGVYVNGVPTYKVKLLVETDDGPKFILYSLMDTIKPYGVNTILKIKMYKDLFLIIP